MGVHVDLGDKDEFADKGGMSLSLAQPMVREWLGKRRATLRPLGTFFNTSNFQVPPSAGRLSKRVVKNIEFFQSNYVCVFLVLVLYCLISSPLLLVVLAGAGGLVFWVLGASMFFITAHAAFYNYDALDVPEDQEQLIGAIVEEV